ncbi:hypothetical protein TREMEDRAFT_65714, partial [Tremella mesenterica DSM 1558]|uniref:uncharacterized protein n=1 Tax=Tremella mesenterica (strain ATCC 24925 / CBS 8224 / DSM 1558 / NBRC 9311 / NRRL Y-6157 / RJB 2259-6 / UBC 559-6) TaxID=578456 RepID=UPI00032BDBD7
MSSDNEDKLLKELQAIQDNSIIVDPTAYLAVPTLRRYQEVWKLFDQWLGTLVESGSNNLLPGSPTTASELLNPSTPHMPSRAFASFLEWWASYTSAAYYKLPLVNTAVTIIGRLFRYLDLHKQDKLPRFTRLSVFRHIQGDMVKDKFLLPQKRHRSFTSQGGMKQLAQAFFSPKAQHSLRARWQGSLSPGDAQPIDTLGVRYQDFLLCITPADEPDSPPTLALRLTTLHGKRDASRDKEHVLLAESELWSCPVHWLLVLATLDDTLPCPLDLLLHSRNFPAPRVLQFGRGNLAICQSTRQSARSSWTVGSLYKVMTRTSLIAGFPYAITPYALRRSMAVHMFASGVPLAQISKRLGQTLCQEVLRRYIGEFPATDITAHVHEAADSDAIIAMEHLLLHPNMLSLAARAPISLSPEGIEAIHDDAEYVEELERHRSLRQDLLQGSAYKQATPEAQAQIKLSWSRLRVVWGRKSREIFRQECYNWFQAHDQERLVMLSQALDNLQDEAALDQMPDVMSSTADIVEYDPEAFEYVLRTHRLQYASDFASLAQASCQEETELDADDIDAIDDA